MTERELGNVERQIGPRDLMVRTHDPALQERPERIEVVGVDRSTDVLARTVIDRLMAIPTAELAPELPVAVVLVRGEKGNVLRHGFTNESLQGLSRCRLDDLGDDLALTGDR